MSVRRLADLISIILGPHVWLPVLFFLIIFNSGLNSHQLRIIFPTVLFLQVIIPVSYIVFAPKLGWTEKWDMEKIEERKPFLVMLLVLSLISFLIIYLFGNQKLFNLSLTFLLLLVVILAISRYWKVSLHTSLNTAASIIINFLFNWRVPFLYIIIPIIFWARVKLRKHDMPQLVTGILVSGAVLLAGLAFFNYI
jgi:hypothetical protein